MINRIKHKLKTMAETAYDKYQIKDRYRREIRRYNDPRRKKIVDSVVLSLEETMAIDEVYEKNWGRSIPYTWHRYYKSFTGKFDPFYVPEMIWGSEFENFMNLEKAYCKVFANKSVFELISSAAGVKTPHTIISCQYGLLKDCNNVAISVEGIKHILDDIGVVFIKPTVDTGSGKGCFIANLKNGIDLISKRDTLSILSELGNNFAIQERLVAHNSLGTLYPDSINTFRIVTYRWKDQFHTIPSVLRMGRNGSYIDNAHAGGIFIAIDDDGTLHDKAFTEFGRNFSKHPDTNVTFEGYNIPLFKLCRNKALYLHSCIPQLGVANWDFTIDQDGNPIVIEVNLKAGGIWLSEIAHGCGPFGERTAEILTWLRFMKSVNADEREKYAYGNMPKGKTFTSVSVRVS